MEYLFIRISYIFMYFLFWVKIGKIVFFTKNDKRSATSSVLLVGSRMRETVARSKHVRSEILDLLHCGITKSWTHSCSINVVELARELSFFRLLLVTCFVN